VVVQVSLTSIYTILNCTYINLGGFISIHLKRCRGERCALSSAGKFPVFLILLSLLLINFLLSSTRKLSLNRLDGWGTNLIPQTSASCVLNLNIDNAAMFLVDNGVLPYRGTLLRNPLISPTPDANSLDLKCFDFFQATKNNGVLRYQGHFSQIKYRANDSVLRYPVFLVDNGVLPYRGTPFHNHLIFPTPDTNSLDLKCFEFFQSTENDGVLRYQGHFSHIKYKSNDSVLRYLHPCLVALQFTESGGFLRYQGQFYYLNYFFISQLSLRHDTNGVLQYPNFYYFYRYTYTHLMFLRLVLRYLLENPVAVPAAVPTSI